MSALAAAGRFADRATPARLALALALVLAALAAVIAINHPVEEALRPGPCEGLDCLRPLRPETRQAGYTAEEFRAFLQRIGPLRGRALLGLAADLPLIAAIAAALLTAAGLARHGLPLSERTRALIVGLPLAYAAADCGENALLALAYAGLADVGAVVPWASALKFGCLAASAALSGLLALAGWSLGRSE